MSRVGLSNDVSQYCGLAVARMGRGSTASLAASVMLWSPQPETVSPTFGETHVWRAWVDQTEVCLEQSEDLLSEDERARADRFHFEQDRRRFVLRRGLLRMILGQYLQVESACIRFAYGAFGKPVLSFPIATGATGLHFSVSHSAGLVLFAVTAGTPVGIDVERIRVIPEAGSIVARYFPSQDAAHWQALPCNERPAAFLRQWTREEALLKASSRGIAGAWGQAPFAAAICDSTGPGSADHYTLIDLAPAPDYVASIAFRS